MSQPDVDGSIVVQFEDSAVVLREEEPGYLLGSMTLLGTEFHVEAMRVEPLKEGQHVQEAWNAHENENEDRLDDLMNFTNARLSTVSIPGFEGEYVLVITPYGM